MNTLRLRLLQGGLAFGALLYTAIASADQGTIVLVTGQVVIGEVSQVVAGEYIMVTLPSGEVKAIAWAQIGSFQVGGSATVSTGNPTVAPPPAPAPAPYTPPPPPPPNYGGYGYGEPPPPPPPPPPAFIPTWMFGVRLGSLSPTGKLTGGTVGRDIDTVASSGWSFEGDVGIHLTPGFTLYALWEHGALGRGTGNSLGTDSSAMNTVGGGMSVKSNGLGTVGFLFDAALGYRWFGFSYPTAVVDQTTGTGTILYGKAVAEAVVVRLGMGLAINATKKFGIDVLGHITWGSLREHKGGGLEGAEPGSHATYGISVGGRWDL